MRTLTYVLAALLAALFFGCGDDDNGDRPDASVGGPDAAIADASDDGAVADGGDGDATATEDAGPMADAVMCTADEFIGCADTDTASFCSSGGDAVVDESCMGFGCNATEMRCNECTPSATECQGDTLVTCDADGLIAESEPCALGCDANNSECNVLEPSNLAADTCETAGATDLIVAADMTIDTGAAACTDFVAQTGGPSICLLKYATVDIQEGATLTIVGERALALVATTSMTIAGTVDASGTGTTSGPGVIVNDGTGGDGDTTVDGGGGAGFGTAGASGGTGSGGTAGAGGLQVGTADLVPLLGGASGGRGGQPFQDPRALGGGGGGAVQLVSCAAVTISGVVHAGAGGGEGGAGVTSILSPGGGAGGGSGGGVLIEGGSVTVAGTLAANGGGGGGGGVSGSETVAGNPGDPGADATADTTIALGGAAEFESGDGGSGGATVVNPTAGQNPTVSSGAAGGGGGAVGRIRINVRPGTTPDLAGAILSPAPSEGEVAVH